MNYDEWIKSSRVEVSTRESFQAGQDCLKADIQQLWLETDTYDDFANEVKLLADIKE